MIPKEDNKTGGQKATRPFVSNDGIEITKRFFSAIDILKMQGKIHGLKVFTDKHNINRWNLYTIKKNPDKALLKPEYILYLCRDYNVSLDWIFYGEGDFYEVEKLLKSKGKRE